MRVSIITASYNNIDTIEDSIQSVISQKYKNVEYLIVDGGSTDGSVDIIKKYQGKITKWISEKDEGIYHALNKGLKIANGDIIGFLHADDIYVQDTVIDRVVSCMLHSGTESCYGDLQYVHKKNVDKIIRYWKSCPYNEGLFQRGWMPPHPTFFVKKKVYDDYGGFNTSFKIAADYELMLRFLGRNRIASCYIAEVLVKMRIGGKSNSSLRNIIIKSSEDYKAWKINNLSGGLYAIVLKNLTKLPQFFQRE